MENFWRGELLKAVCLFLTLHLPQITKSVGINVVVQKGFHQQMKDLF